MQYRRFSTGDRVVTNKPWLGIPVGTVGTVVTVSRFPVGCYDVHFDGYGELCVVFGPDLIVAPAPDTAAAPRESPSAGS
jgi:hypothetical protein